MINNSNDQLQNTINGLLGKNFELGEDVKKLINSLSEEDIKKISLLMKNNDLQKIASSIIESKKQKG